VGVDEQLLRAFYGADARTPLTYLMIALTGIGTGWTALGLLPLLAWRTSRRIALYLALAIGAQSALVGLVRLAAPRTRPWIALGLHPILEAPHSSSFPSGHATASFTVAAFLSVVLFARGRRRSRVVLGCAGLFALAAAISASRVYLGAHWPSDVASGAVLGSLVGVAFATVYLRAGAAAAGHAASPVWAGTQTDTRPRPTKPG
jgi:undecaprenyl-diphosphatase